MLFSNRSQEALLHALQRASDNTHIYLSSEELEEFSLGLLSLCSASLKMRMRQKSIGRPVPKTGVAPQKGVDQMSLFDTDLDGQGGGATPNGAC